MPNKVLLIGNSGVGKSSLISVHCGQSFKANGAGTIGVEFKIKEYPINDKLVTLQIWDTAGQERFNAITRPYYRNSDAILLVFSLDNLASFRNLEYWLKEVNKYSPNDPLIVLIGNKADLQQRVSEKQISHFVANHKINNYIKTSCKEALNVDKLFQQVAEKTLAASKIRPHHTTTGSVSLTTAKANVELTGRNTEQCCHS